jgi:hypothetical protein
MRPEAVTHLAIATMRLDAITTAVAAASLAASGLTVPGLPALPPAPRTPEDLQRRTTIDAALRRAWTGLDGFSTATPEEDAAIDAVSGENGNTYGEVTFDGARCVFDALGLYDAPAGAVFADLGSGVGQMVAHCAVECAVAGSVGVRAGQESEIPNFKGSSLSRFPLVLADFWTSDHLSERSRRVDAFSGTRARGTLTLKRR